MAGKKREKELARAKYERQQVKRSMRADRQKRSQRIIAVVVVIALVAGGVGWFLLSRSSSPATPDASPTLSPSVPPSASPSASATSAMDCAAPGTNRTTDLTWASAPKETINPKKAYTIALETNCGTIEIATNPGKAPITTNSEVFLTKQGFYDDTSCHRLTTEGLYVLQCGDPSASGSGGPGYQIADENLPADGQNDYPAGTVAMANAGPGTSGSQFFIVYEDTTLPPAYSIWGKVTKGLDIVKQVAAQGTTDGGTDGAPAQPVFITKGSVRES